MRPTRTEDLRQEKTFTILNLFMEGGEWTRRELQEATKISYGTIAIVLSGLERAGVIALEGLDQSNGGRRAGRYRLVVHHRVFAQIEVGNDGFVWSLRDLSGSELAGGEWRDDETGSINASLEEVVRTVFRTLHELQIERDRLYGFGISIPGHYRRESDTVIIPSTPRIGELAVMGTIQKHFSGPVSVESDVVAAALYDLERVIGTGALEGTILYLAVTSDGVGATLLLNGKVHYGATGHAGEVHMLPVRTQDGYTTLGEIIDPNVSVYRIGEITGRNPSFNQFRDMISSGHSATETLYPEIVDAFTQAIFLLDNVLDPDSIVIAGVYCRYGPRLARDVARRLVETAEPKLMDNVAVLQSDGSEGLARAGLWRLQAREWARSVRLPG